MLHPGGAAGGGGGGHHRRLQGEAGPDRRVDGRRPDVAPRRPRRHPAPRQRVQVQERPVPFRDLPLGTCWRLGSGATSSNRKDGQRSIQLFSDGGHYNGQGDVISYASGATGSATGYADEPTDLPYEPPRAHPREHDRGPTSALAQLLHGGKPGCAWPDFHALGVRAHPSLGWGPIHRGRYAGALAPRARRPGVERRPLHRSRHDGRRRAALPGLARAPPASRRGMPSSACCPSTPPTSRQPP